MRAVSLAVQEERGVLLLSPGSIWGFLLVLFDLGEVLALVKRTTAPGVQQDAMCRTWKSRHYSNKKLKEMVGWEQRITTERALRIYFDYKRTGER